MASALLLGAVAAAPVVVAALLARIGTGKWLGRFVPFFSDEIDYWRETATFLTSGFGGGHYGWNEHPASAGWTHFGPHGPVVELIYGLPGKLFGWSFAAPLYVNLAVFLIAGVLALVIAGRPGARVGVGVAAVLCTFWPLMLYLPSAMEEPLNQAIAILAAGAFARLVTRGGSRRLFGWLLALIIAASLLRVTWSFLLLPWVVLLTRGAPRRSRLLALAAALAGILVLFGFYSWTAAQYPFGIDYQVQHAHGLGTKLRLLWENTKLNIQLFLHLRSGDSTTLETLQRFELVAAIVALLGAGGWLLDRTRREKVAATDRDFVLVALLILIPMVAATVVAWQVGLFADFRALAPCFVLVLVLGMLVGGRRVRYSIAALVLVNVAFVVTYANLARDWNRLHLQPDTHAISSARGVFDVAINPAPGAGPWCRTLLWGINYVPPALLALRPEVAVMLSFAPGSLHAPLRSGYVALPAGSETLAARDGLRALAALPPYGQLYSNPAARCQRPSPRVPTSS